MKKPLLLSLAVIVLVGIASIPAPRIWAQTADMSPLPTMETMTPAPTMDSTTPAPTVAATTQNSMAPSEVNDVSSLEFKGELLKKEGNTLTLKTDDGTKVVTVPEAVSIKRNTVTTNLSEVQPGDELTITQTADGQVLGVEAVSSQVSDTSKWLIPLLVIGVIAAFIAWRLLKKANQPHIKTTVS